METRKNGNGNGNGENGNGNERTTWGPLTEEELIQVYKLAVEMAKAIPEDCSAFIAAHAAGVLVGQALQNMVGNDRKELRGSILKKISDFIELCTTFFDHIDEKEGGRIHNSQCTIHNYGTV